MKFLNIVFVAFMIITLLSSCDKSKQSSKKTEVKEIMIRISEIKIDSTYLKEYTAILKEESEASVRLETGVISIYPMYEKENPTEVRILEMYASNDAYQSHLKTPHFQKYKTTTVEMVKSLRLIDMHAIDPGTMPLIFFKLKH